MVKGILVRTDGRIEAVEVDFQMMKELCGTKEKPAFLQCVPFGDTGADFYVDEDGKYNCLPINHLASALCEQYEVGMSGSDHIVGNFVLIGGCVAGDHTDIPDALAQELLARSRFPAKK